MESAFPHASAPTLPHSGVGRIVLRYFVTSAGLSGSASDYISIDGVAFSAGLPGYTVGGNAAGLTGGGLHLSLNGGAPLVVGADGAFQRCSRRRQSSCARILRAPDDRPRRRIESR